MSEFDSTQQTVVDSSKTKSKTPVIDLSVKLPVIRRLRDRVNKIKEESSAKNIREDLGTGRYKWHTLPPKMHIANLRSEIVDGVGKISYQVYKTDKNGNKVPNIQEVKVTGEDGIERTKIASSEYVIEKEVIETIKPYEKRTTQEHSYE